MSRAKQRMKNVRVGKSVRQVSDVAETTQDIADLEVEGKLEQVIESGTTQSDLDTLGRLVAQLREAVAEIPDEGAEDGAKALKRAEAIMEEARAEKPDKEKLTITGESLLLAAKNLSAVTPAVLAIAIQIVNVISQFAR